MRVHKTWGHEDVLHNGDYCCKLLVYTRRIASSLHYHARKHECFYVASGAFQIEVDDRPATHLYPGDHVVLAPRTLHRLRCLEPGTVVEASSFDDPEDCVRVVPSDA